MHSLTAKQINKLIDKNYIKSKEPRNSQARPEENRTVECGVECVLAGTHDNYPFGFLRHSFDQV